eukprot:236108-Pyramimonas_sp.AAC.1
MPEKPLEVPRRSQKRLGVCSCSALRRPKAAPAATKMVPTTPERPPRWPPKTAPRGPQDGLGDLRDAQHGLQDGTQAPHGGPKLAQRGPQNGFRRHLTGQERP